MFRYIKFFIKLPIKFLIRLLPIKLRLNYRLPISILEKQKVIKQLVDQSDRSKTDIESKVLVWGAGGMPSMAKVESIISTALKLRNVDVNVAMCDGLLSGCVLREIQDEIPIQEWSKQCKSCSKSMKSQYISFNLPVHMFSDYVTKELILKIREEVNNISLDKILTYKHLGVDVGRYAYSSAIRYSKDVELQGCEDVIREYLYSAIIVTEAAVNILADLKPSVILLSHGIYADWGPVIDVAANNNIPIINWGAAYRHDHLYMRTVRNRFDRNRMMLDSEIWLNRNKKNLNVTEEKRLDDYLDVRYKKGYFDITRFGKLPHIGKQSNTVYELLGVSGKRPLWCVFCHINWDAVFNDAEMVFDNVNEWIDFTLNTITHLESVDWLIKLHPNEPGWATGKGVGDHIIKQFQDLPSHVHVISSDVKINNVDLFPLLDGGITLHGTSGLEMALMGKTVITAANSHYSNKGFTYDASNRQQYKQYLMEATELKPLTKSQILSARRYAYSFFVQRQLPISSVVKSDNYNLWDFNYIDCYKLITGNDDMFDFLCENIMKGGDFIMNEHLLRLADKNDMEGQT